MRDRDRTQAASCALLTYTSPQASACLTRMQPPKKRTVCLLRPISQLVTVRYTTLKRLLVLCRAEQGSVQGW